MPRSAWIVRASLLVSAARVSSPEQVFNWPLVTCDDLGDARSFLNSCGFNHVVDDEQMNGAALDVCFEFEVHATSINGDQRAVEFSEHGQVSEFAPRLAGDHYPAGVPKAAPLWGLVWRCPNHPHGLTGTAWPLMPTVLINTVARQCYGSTEAVQLRTCVVIA